MAANDWYSSQALDKLRSQSDPERASPAVLCQEQVKQTDKVGRPEIDAFEAVMTREERTKGFFVAFDYTTDALREIDDFFRKSGKAIVALTVREILDAGIAKKLV